MRVFFPRVSFTLDYGENAHSGDLGLISVGYGLHQAWIFCAMFAPAVLFSSQGVLGGENIFGMSTAAFVSLVVNFVCLFFEGLTDQKLKHIYRKKATIIAAALLMCAGTLLNFVQLPWGIPRLFLYLVIGISTGFGSSILLLAWGVRFARCSVSSIRANAVIGFGLAFAMYVTIVTVLGFPFGGVATAILPLLELAILLKHQIFGIGKSAGVQLFSPLPVRLSTFLVKFGVPITIFCFALGFLRLVAIRPDFNLGLQYALLSIILMAVTLFVIVLLLPEQEDGWSFDFKVVGLFVVVAIAALSFGGHEQTLFQGISALTAYLCFEALIWIYFSEFSQLFRLSPVLVFGVGRGCAGFATAAIAVANAIATTAYESAIFTNTTFSLIVLIVLMASYILLPSQAEIRSILSPNALAESIENTAAEVNRRVTENEVFDESMVTRYAQDVLPEDAAPITNQNVASSLAGTNGQSGALPPSNSTQVTDAQNQAQFSLQANIGIESGAAKDPRPTASPTAFSSLADTPAQETPAGHIGSFREKCQVVANTYMLSAREQEVLFYLAKGYNAALIQEKLYISEGTTKTHMRHIYRKLDVHTQQDLIRVVEDAKFEA